MYDHIKDKNRPKQFHEITQQQHYLVYKTNQRHLQHLTYQQEL